MTFAQFGMGLGLKREKITLLHLSLSRDFLNKYRGSSPMWRQCIMYLGLPKSFMNKNHDIGPIWHGISMGLGLKSAFRTITISEQILMTQTNVAAVSNLVGSTEPIYEQKP